MKKLSILFCLMMAAFVTGCADESATPTQVQPTISKSQQPMDDAGITTKVKATFIKEKLFSNKDVNALSVHVDTVNGVVYLSGTADSHAQARNAVRLARSVSGVVDVVSHIVVAK